MVSNVGFISKVVEKGTLIQLTEHYNENRLIPTYQSAYKRNHSCETSLVKLVDGILWWMEEQLVTSVVILDLSATFDTVDHKSSAGYTIEEIWSPSDNTKQWYHNYLKSRKFRA